MSFIHYKLITNQNYEKIAFDGVSLSVGEIKKMVMEKKFRKNAPSAASSNTGNSSSRKSDVDLEVTNVDTNEVYKNDAELIPKNSRVQISRVVKNIGPAIAGGTITQTHKDNEKLADFRLKSRLHERQARNELDLDDSILLGSNGSKNSDTHSGQDSPDLASQLYDDILTEDGVNGEHFLDQNDPDTFTLVNNRIDIKIPKQGVSEHKNEQDRPPGDFLCPFDDGKEKHLMENAIIVPCCGYFICCEKCIRSKLSISPSIECPHESCSQEITINHRLTPYPPMRNKITDYLKSQSNMLQVPVEKLATKFRLDQKLVEEQASRPSPSKGRAQNSPGLSPRSTNRPLLKLAVKLNSPKPNTEEKKESEPKENGPESKKRRSESRSPVSSRSSSPSKVSSDSECKVSENGSISPVSQSQESRSNSPSPPISPKEKPVQTLKETEPEAKHKTEDSLQPIQPVYSHQYIPPQQFYPYNMPTGQMYPQMEPFFNSRFPRPSFAMQPPQTMFNPNMMRYPAPGALPAQNFYQMYPGGHQGFMSEQFYANRPHAPFQNGYQYQNFQRNSKIVRRRSRSRSRRSPERSRRKRSYSRSRSRSPRRHHRNSRHRSRSRSAARRDKRASYRRKSSSRKRDKSGSRSRDRQKKECDEKAPKMNRIEESKSKPVNKENEMDQREKTIHKLNNLMHRKSNVEAKSFANGAAAVTLAANQIKESQLGEKDAKKNQIVILLKTNAKQNEKSDEKKTGEDVQVVSPVKKSAVKRKVHLKKELATTSTVKKIMMEKLDEKKCAESEDKSEDFLDIAIDEKINF